MKNTFVAFIAFSACATTLPCYTASKPTPPPNLNSLLPTVLAQSYMLGIIQFARTITPITNMKDIRKKIYSLQWATNQLIVANKKEGVLTEQQATETSNALFDTPTMLACLERELFATAPTESFVTVTTSSGPVQLKMLKLQ